ncbi:Os05g0553900 [Oryza sativa Japonica Group]|uniref:Os05g0553900 protein n=1 Tax=Oryza sativa subsp. japonica TaxID=39947 RepID=A0A0P0WQU1_ORYSJ|nr:Os05g0553900 [Oryza sativa Japonica Group]
MSDAAMQKPASTGGAIRNSRGNSLQPMVAVAKTSVCRKDGMRVRALTHCGSVIGIATASEQACRSKPTQRQNRLMLQMTKRPWCETSNAGATQLRLVYENLKF